MLPPSDARQAADRFLVLIVSPVFRSILHRVLDPTQPPPPRNVSTSGPAAAPVFNRRRRSS